METDKLVKIRRYGESFWVRDIRELEGDIFVGVVANNLDPETNPFHFGDPIPFAACEICEVLHSNPRTVN